MMVVKLGHNTRNMFEEVPLTACYGMDSFWKILKAETSLRSDYCSPGK